MAGALSDFAENKIIDHVFRGIAWTAPTSLYTALFTAAPNDTGGGTEVSGGSYARINLAPSSTNWTNTQASGSGASTGTSGTTTNGVAITFAAPTANWGTIGWVGVFDAVTSGNLIWWAALVAPKTVNNGDAAPSFPIGAVSFQIDS